MLPLGIPLPALIVTERALRALAAWPAREEVVRFRTVVAGRAKRQGLAFDTQWSLLCVEGKASLFHFP